MPNQKGITSVLILISVLVILTIAVGFYFSQKHQPGQSSPKSTPLPSPTTSNNNILDFSSIPQAKSINVDVGMFDANVQTIPFESQETELSNLIYYYPSDKDPLTAKLIYIPTSGNFWQAVLPLGSSITSDLKSSFLKKLADMGWRDGIKFNGYLDYLHSVQQTDGACGTEDSLIGYKDNQLRLVTIYVSPNPCDAPSGVEKTLPGPKGDVYKIYISDPIPIDTIQIYIKTHKNESFPSPTVHSSLRK